MLDNGTYRIAHFGDLGCELTEEQAELLKDLDMALIPVGGFFTIDAKTAKKIVNSIQPKTVIPMHYSGDGFGFDVIAPVEAYLDLCGDVVLTGESAIEISEQTPAGTVVLVPQNLQK